MWGDTEEGKTDTSKSLGRGRPGGGGGQGGGLAGADTKLIYERENYWAIQSRRIRLKATLLVCGEWKTKAKKVLLFSK